MIVDLSKKTFNSEITELIHKLLGEKTHLLKENNIVQNILYKLKINRLLGLYDKPYDKTEIHNNRKIELLFTIIILLWVFFIGIVIILNYNCSKDIDIKHLLIENTFVFLFIGAAELLFFKYIAFKFIPVEPSYISKKGLDIMKEKVNNAIEIKLKE